MSNENDKFFEVPVAVPDKEDEPFKDFMQEVDSMLVNMTTEPIDLLPAENLPPENLGEDTEVSFAELAERPELAQRSLPPHSDPPEGDDAELHFELDTEAMLNEVDAGFLEMQQTFMAIMQQVLKPVARYVKAILHGEESRELFEIINFTVTPLIDKVEKVELFNQTADLLTFKSTLTRILATHFGTLSEEMRQQLVSSFMAVKKTFNLDLRGNHRAVVNVLEFYRRLCFSRDVDVDQIRKFFAIGIPSLTWVRRSAVSEIVSMSGMSLEQVRVLKKMALNFREVTDEELVSDVPPPPTAMPMASL